MQELLRAKHITMGQIARLEEAWKTNPQATLDTLVQPSADEDPEPVVLKCALLTVQVMCSSGQAA